MNIEKYIKRFRKEFKRTDMPTLVIAQRKEIESFLKTMAEEIENEVWTEAWNDGFNTGYVDKEALHS